MLRIVKDRYLDPKLDATEASDVLERYDPEEAGVVRAANPIGNVAGGNPEAIKEEASLYDWYPMECLFGYLRPTHPQRNALILEAMDHPNAAVRRTVTGAATRCRSHWRPKLVKGLGDPSASIRKDSVEAIVEGFG